MELRKFFIIVSLSGCETRAVLAYAPEHAAELVAKGQHGVVLRDVNEHVILVEDVGGAPSDAVAGAWWPENGPSRPKFWLFITEHRRETAIDLYSSRERYEAAAWAWVRENWAELDLEGPIPDDLEAAFDALRRHELYPSAAEVELDATPEQGQPLGPPLHPLHAGKAKEADEQAWAEEFNRLDAADLCTELGHMVDAMDLLRRGVKPIADRDWRRFQVLTLVVDRRLRNETAP